MAAEPTAERVSEESGRGCDLLAVLCWPVTKFKKLLVSNYLIYLVAFLCLFPSFYIAIHIAVTQETLIPVNNLQYYNSSFVAKHILADGKIEGIEWLMLSKVRLDECRASNAEIEKKMLAEGREVVCPGGFDEILCWEPTDKLEEVKMSCKSPSIAIMKNYNPNATAYRKCDHYGWRTDGPNSTKILTLYGECTAPPGNTFWDMYQRHKQMHPELHSYDEDDEDYSSSGSGYYYYEYYDDDEDEYEYTTTRAPEESSGSVRTRETPLESGSALESGSGSPGLEQVGAEEVLERRRREVEEQEEKKENKRLEEVYKPLVKTYTIGYSVSIGTLVISTFILLYFGPLRCTRNIIHVNLFCSFVLRAVVVLLNDRIAHDPLLEAIGEDRDVQVSVLNNHWTKCRIMTAVYYYAFCTNYMWVLVEGIYLYSLMYVNRFANDKFNVAYALLGWVAPIFIVIPWLLVRLLKANNMCWDTTDGTALMIEHIIESPLSVAMIINLILFVCMVAMLFSKIKTEQTRGNRSPGRKYFKSTMTCIVMFGVHKLVFHATPRPDTDHFFWHFRMYWDLFFESFQGFFLAIVYCFLNEEVHQEFKRAWQRMSTNYELNNLNRRRSRTSISTVAGFNSGESANGGRPSLGSIFGSQQNNKTSAAAVVTEKTNVKSSSSSQQASEATADESARFLSPTATDNKNKKSPPEETVIDMEVLTSPPAPKEEERPRRPSSVRLSLEDDRITTFATADDVTNDVESSTTPSAATRVEVVDEESCPGSTGSGEEKESLLNSQEPEESFPDSQESEEKKTLSDSQGSEEKQSLLESKEPEEKQSLLEPQEPEESFSDSQGSEEKKSLLDSQESEEKQSLLASCAEDNRSDGKEEEDKAEKSG